VAICVSLLSIPVESLDRAAVAVQGTAKAVQLSRISEALDRYLRRSRHKYAELMRLSGQGGRVSNAGLRQAGFHPPAEPKDVRAGRHLLHTARL
jgi:hypothetical protein